MVISAPDAIEPAFARAQNDRVDGVVVSGPTFFNERVRVGASALAHGIPTVWFSSYGWGQSRSEDAASFRLALCLHPPWSTRLDKKSYRDSHRPAEARNIAQGIIIGKALVLLR